VVILLNEDVCVVSYKTGDYYFQGGEKKGGGVLKAKYKAYNYEDSEQINT